MSFLFSIYYCMILNLHCVCVRAVQNLQKYVRLHRQDGTGSSYFTSITIVIVFINDGLLNDHDDSRELMDTFIFSLSLWSFFFNISIILNPRNGVVM